MNKKEAQGFVDETLKDIYISIGIDVPSTHDKLVQRVAKDAMESAGPDFTTEDIRIGFRRLLER